jgi:outer membrane protein
LQYALDNNIQVKKSKVNYLSGNEDTEEAKARLFPSLTASVTQGFVNYPSNKVETNNSYSGNYTLNSNWTIYDGNQRNNTIKQRKLQDSMNELAVEQSEDDIRLSIIQVYMQVLYAMEAIRINENTVETSTAERDRAKELYAEGSISKVDLAQLESQLSTDKYQLVSAQTSLDNYKLQLKQLLELDINQDINIASPILTETDVLGALPSKQNIYETALSVMPQIKSSELSVSSAELEIKKAKGAYMPTLSMNAGIGTGHLSGTDYTFGSQIWNKFNESVGLTLSIPIFANRSNKTALNKAKYALTTSELEHLNEQKTLLKEVETIYLDAVSAQTKYVSSSENLAYVTESYDLTQQQFFLGMKNTVELLTEKNNYLTAQQTQLQSKYMAIMSKELLNVYQKKSTELKY